MRAVHFKPARLYLDSSYPLGGNGSRIDRYVWALTRLVRCSHRATYPVKRANPYLTSYTLP